MRGEKKKSKQDWKHGDRVVCLFWSDFPHLRDQPHYTSNSGNTHKGQKCPLFKKAVFMPQKLGQQQATEIPMHGVGTSGAAGSRLAAKDWNKRQNMPRQKSDNGYWRKAVNSNKARKARVKESVKYRPFNSLPSSSCQESRFRQKPAMHMANSTSRQAKKLKAGLSNPMKRNYKTYSTVLHGCLLRRGSTVALAAPVSLKPKQNK